MQHCKRCRGNSINELCDECDNLSASALSIIDNYEGQQPPPEGGGF
jgi:hypothetical protein